MNPRHLLFKGFVCALLVIGSWISALHADGGGPMRPATPAESESAKRISTTVEKALPKPPAGWEAEVSRDETVTDVPVDQDKYLRTFCFTMRWSNPKVLEASGRMLEKEATERKPGAKNQDRLNELNKQNERIAKEFGEAIAKGDMALAEKKKAELDAVVKQMEPLFKESDEEVKTIVRKVAVHDGNLDIQVRINETEQDVSEAATCPGPVEGVVAWHIPGKETDEGSWKEGETEFFIGPWKLEDRGESKVMVGDARIEKGAFTPQTVRVTIIGDDARVKQVSAEIGWKTLKDLIGGGGK